MPADLPDAVLRDVAGRFSELWRAMERGAEGPYPEATRQLLVDGVRNALDRGDAELSQNDGQIVANSFLLEALVQDGPTTQLYRARHRDLGTLHAVKMPSAAQADDPVVRRLLLREAVIGMAIRSKDVVATQTVLRLADGRPAIVMEWMPDRLSDHLPRLRLRVGEVAAIMTRILAALQAIHAAGFVHCDLSPSNLLLASDDLGDLKMSDFGISLAIGERHADLDIAFAGRPDFASPEQKAGEPLEARSDLYAAGLLLSLLLHHCEETGEKIEALKSLALHLSQQHPEDRPAGAEEAARLLSAIITGG